MPPRLQRPNVVSTNMTARDSESVFGGSVMTLYARQPNGVRIRTKRLEGGTRHSPVSDLLEVGVRGLVKLFTI